MGKKKNKKKQKSKKSPIEKIYFFDRFINVVYQEGIPLIELIEVTKGERKNKKKFNKTSKPEYFGLLEAPISDFEYETLLIDQEITEDFETAILIKEAIDFRDKKANAWRH